MRICNSTGRRRQAGTLVCHILSLLSYSYRNLDLIKDTASHLNSGRLENNIRGEGEKIIAKKGTRGKVVIGEAAEKCGLG